MSKCAHCSSTEFIAEKADAFKTAAGLIKEEKFDLDFGEVMELARFLIGDGDE